MQVCFAAEKSSWISTNSQPELRRLSLFTAELQLSGPTVMQVKNSMHMPIPIHSKALPELSDENMKPQAHDRAESAYH